MSDDEGGWPLVWALALVQLISWGSIYYSFSLFTVAMEQELGWSRSTIEGALSFGLLIAGLGAYPVGAWIDRHGGRGVMTAGSIVGTLSLAAWSRVESVAGFYLIWAGLGLAMAATLYEPVFAVLVRRFPISYRRRIMALTLIGGFASTVFMPLTQLCIGRFGWRDATLGLALCNLALAVPIHGLTLRRETTRTAPVESAAQAANRTALRRALRHPVFWGLAVAFTAYYAAFTAITFHLIPLLIDRGVSMTTAIAAVALIGPAQVAGRIGMLVFGRRLSTVAAGQAAMTLFPASLLPLLAFPGSTPGLFLFALTYGGANGIVTIVRGTALPDLLGRQAYGAISGALTVPANLAKAAAPFGAALIWSGFGDYRAVLWAVLGGGLLGAASFRYAVRRAAGRVSR
ncbi:MAG TPA: MFS transporter [Aliidongia sp.]|nr:MFS transporter [Aliidongia sp.]